MSESFDPDSVKPPQAEGLSALDAEAAEFSVKPPQAEALEALDLADEGSVKPPQ